MLKTKNNCLKIWSSQNIGYIKVNYIFYFFAGKHPLGCIFIFVIN